MTAPWCSRCAAATNCSATATAGPAPGEEMRGISLVDLETVAGDRRMIGNVVLRCELEPGKPETLVGFENHAGRTTLGPGLKPLGKVSAEAATMARTVARASTPDT